ncbi:CRISPR-associated endonuclease Cas2 [Blastopirellula sp. J2-11]|uniref:CRISPR-associated endonuclease Cas2 n=1 Tax=Blastopirellula sp. J2-11 TaxID=2943192 RepID=UPI0021C580A6|nr:CRISPR-associated endonuclease Cas2 [Blastopirellula sp. J2-11]UUO04511.1 CRISPR-associated endonuclease Cas2 [Blastopirellula sp. J2-11]
MYVLVTYDVNTENREGRRRLRQIAKTCLDYGQRVQYSVFELKVDPAQWAACKAKLTDLMNPAKDSLRFYYLGSNWKRKVEHCGAKPSLDVDGPLIA